MYSNTKPFLEDILLSYRTLQVGYLAALALIGLRLVIGWHFFDEGRSKLLSGGFSSVPFFHQAKGPLAPFLHAWSGHRSPRQWLDRDASEQHWNDYQNRLVQRFRFDESQRNSADKILEQHIRLLRAHFRANDDRIMQYLNSAAVIDTAETDSAVAAVPALSEHINRNRIELREISAELVAPVRDYWRSLEMQLHNLRHDQQQQPSEFPILGAGGIFRTATIDRSVPYFTLVVGGLLLIGLFSRIASLAGAVFLLMVIATQPPWVAGTIPTYSQLIETCGLLAIAGIGAGRLAGLDFFVYAWRNRRTSC